MTGLAIFEDQLLFGNELFRLLEIWKLVRIDLDGDIDILITNREEKNEICLNMVKVKIHNYLVKFGSADDRL